MGLVYCAWFIAGKSVIELKRDEIEHFIQFCQQPPKHWIGLKKTARFRPINGQRIPNLGWHLFIATLKKSDIKHEEKPTLKDYTVSPKTLQSIFIALSSFFNHLIREDIKDVNPITQIRQKSRFLRQTQSHHHIHRLTTEQGGYVIKTANTLARKNPKKHERTLFIMTALYPLYLRISELVASQRWSPKMGDFYQDSQGRWWFKTVGKGNSVRHQKLLPIH